MMAELDERALPLLCMRLLEHMSIGMIACDQDLVVLGATATALTVLSRFSPGGLSPVGRPLPPLVGRAAQTYLAQAFSERGRRRVPSIHVEPEGGGRAIYVASKRIDDLPPVSMAVRIHEERLDNAELFEALLAKFDLSARDRRVMTFLRQGHDNASIARAMGLTLGTIKVYVHELFAKLGVHSRGELLGVLERVRKGPARVAGTARRLG